MDQKGSRNQKLSWRQGLLSLVFPSRSLPPCFFRYFSWLWQL